MVSFTMPAGRLLALQALLATARAAISVYHTGGMQLGPDGDTDLDGQSGYNGWGTFDQLVDHANPSLGTFAQRYWYGTQYWKGPGSPVILVNPGEQSATGFNVTYTGSARLSGRFAEAVGGAVVVLEHRYWGGSSPFEVLTSENLQYLTLNNSIRDMTYFANNFDAPFDPSGKSGPKDAPWIYTGGSYPGALAGWMAALDPGTFWAYHGTSGVVEAIGDFWQYFVPILEATPKNCTKDLTEVVNHVDDILLHGSHAQKQKLKDKFGLGNLLDADFSSAIENGPWTWQGNQFYSFNTTGNSFYHFCDYIENVWPNSTHPVPGEEGVGSCKALEGYAKWWNEVALPGTCESYGYDEFKGENNTLCFQNLNASNPIFHDLTVGNAGNRQWNWMLCNEPFEYWQDGAPRNQPSLVSRLVTADYWRLQCPLWFPELEYGIAEGKRAESVNAWTGGWDVTNTTRLMYVNGGHDPWRDATVSSKFRPGGPLQSTEELPVWVIPDGFHCSDLYANNWKVNAAVESIVEEEVAQIQKWVGEFYEVKGRRRSVGWSA